jgi:hypothetical protein
MELYVLHDVLHVFFDTIPLVLEKHCEYRIQAQEAIHNDAKADQLSVCSGNMPDLASSETIENSDLLSEENGDGTS